LTTNELLELVRAGFTKEEIARITKAETKETEPAKKEPEKQEQGEQKTEPVKPTLEQKFDMLMEKLEASNFMNANQPKEETVDDIIASIINPPTFNNEGGN
jgi:hypothetical protein